MTWIFLLIIFVWLLSLSTKSSLNLRISDLRSDPRLPKLGTRRRETAQHISWSQVPLTPTHSNSGHPDFTPDHHTWPLVILLIVMSWDRTESVPRFHMFGEDSASAYVLHHQMSTVLEFWMRDRRGFGGSDEEFEGQSMSISDWGTYMRFGMYKYRRESCQGSGNWAYIRVRVWGMEIEQGGQKCEVKWNMKQSEVRKHETQRGTAFGEGWVNRIIMMTDGMGNWTCRSPTAHSTVTENSASLRTT